MPALDPSSNHRRDRKPQALDAMNQVAPEPLPCPLGLRRDDELVEIVPAHGLLDSYERVRPTNQMIDRLPSRPAKERDRCLKRPVRRLSVGDIGDQQREPSRLALGSTRDLIE
jgi:hypothetical protein